MKKYDVCAIGELLIDFTENGISERGNPVMEANPGGAPCNVLAMLAKQGYKTAFIGKVGNDIFGRQLRNTLKETGIYDGGLVTDREFNTTLAFVHTLPGGEREFSFYRNPGADTMLGAEELDTDIIENCRIFHFGSLSMTNEMSENATKTAVLLAKRSGALISFDPNLRENLWKDLDTAAEKVRWGLSVCDILKISDNEIQWITGENDYDKAVECLKKEYGIPLIFLTLGADGSRGWSRSGYGEAAVYDVETVEKTGAGDTFFGCILGKILEKGFGNLDDGELFEMMRYANAAASLITTRKGALKVMPSVSEIAALMQSSGGIKK